MAEEALENNNNKKAGNNNNSSSLTFEEFDYEEEIVTTTVTKKKKKKVTFSPSILERNSSFHAQHKSAGKEEHCISVDSINARDGELMEESTSPTKVCVLL